DRPLVVIPLQLAGEACAPLAVMVGDDPDKPRLLTVYEPRNRGKRFEFTADLAEVILGHLDGYVPAGPGIDAADSGGADSGAADPEPGHLDPFPDAPPLLLPNPTA